MRDLDSRVRFNIFRGRVPAMEPGGRGLNAGLPSPAGSGGQDPCPGVRAGCQARGSRWDRLVWGGLAFAALLLLSWWLWVEIGDYPTGNDPGNWFGLGRAFFTGAGKPSGAAYPPLVPAAMFIAGELADPMVVAKVAGVGSVASVFAAVFLCLRRSVHPWLALVAAVFISASRSVVEALGFGGYPQNYAVAGLVVAGSAMASGGRRSFVLAGAALVFTALVHHAYFPLAATVCGLILGTRIAMAPANGRAYLARNGGLALAAGLAAFLPVLLWLRLDGYDPSFSGATPAGLGSIGFDVARTEWLMLAAAFAAAAAALLLGGRPKNPAWLFAGAVVLVALLGLAASGERRVLPLLLIGSTTGCALVLDGLYWRLRETAAAGVPFAVPLALVALIPAFSRTTQDVFTFYRVMSPSMERTASWIDAHPSAGPTGVAADARGWPIGWWFQGLTGATVYASADARYLAFPEERKESLTVARALAAGSPGEGLRIAREDGIGQLVLDLRTKPAWAAILSGTDDALVAYRDGDFVVLRPAPGSGQ